MNLFIVHVVEAAFLRGLADHSISKKKFNISSTFSSNHCRTGKRPTCIGIALCSHSFTYKRVLGCVTPGHVVSLIEEVYLLKRPCEKIV